MLLDILSIRHFNGMNVQAAFISNLSMPEFSQNTKHVSGSACEVISRTNCLALHTVLPNVHTGGIPRCYYNKHTF